MNDRPIPHEKAWPREDRLRMMREVVGMLARYGVLPGIKAPLVAQTYDVFTAEVEAEMMRYVSESDGK